MGLIGKMADKVRNGIRSFLEIQPAPAGTIYINEKLDYESNAIKNKIWYRGQSDELSQLYKSIDADRTLFWKAVPTPGRAIRKIHTGLPANIVDMLVSIVMSDMNSINVSEKQEEWELIAKDNNFEAVMTKALTQTLVVGDGAFKFTINTTISPYPLIEFISGENIEYVYQHGRISRIIFKTVYRYNHRTYLLEETYVKNGIYSHLYANGNEVPLNSIPMTEGLQESVTWEGDFMMAVPFKIYDSNKWEGRGKSVFDSKCDNFDALDEVWSQWLEALRRGRSKEYIPTSLCPRNPDTGEIIKPNDFDNQYLRVEGSLSEDGKDKVELIQPQIPHESYLSTYVTALDLCLQGLISPSTLGIDVKKLDNAEAQREKEKATLYTRNKMVETIQHSLPEVVNTAIQTYEVLTRQAVTSHTVEIPFGEYANPSFESQVETISKGKQGGIMSIEASVEELYGDYKDEEWKKQEVSRLKAEQGIETMEQVSVSEENDGFTVNKVQALPK